MSGAETVKGSTPVALSLGVVGGGELAGAADFGGAVVGVEEDVLEDEGAAKSPILLTEVHRFAQNCKVEKGVCINSVDIGGGCLRLNPLSLAMGVATVKLQVDKETPGSWLEKCYGYLQKWVNNATIVLEKVMNCWKVRYGSALNLQSRVSL
jgi:hypothetical protein